MPTYTDADLAPTPTNVVVGTTGKYTDADLAGPPAPVHAAESSALDRIPNPGNDFITGAENFGLGILRGGSHAIRHPLDTLAGIAQSLPPRAGGGGYPATAPTGNAGRDQANTEALYGPDSPQNASARGTIESFKDSPAYAAGTMVGTSAVLGALTHGEDIGTAAKGAAKGIYAEPPGWRNAGIPALVGHALGIPYQDAAALGVAVKLIRSGVKGAKAEFAAKAAIKAGVDPATLSGLAKKTLGTEFADATPEQQAAVTSIAQSAPKGFVERFLEENPVQGPDEKPPEVGAPQGYLARATGIAPQPAAPAAPAEDMTLLDGLAEWSGLKSFANATPEQQTVIRKMAAGGNAQAATPPATPMTRPPQPVPQAQPAATPPPQQPFLQSQGPVRPPLAPTSAVPDYLKEVSPTDKGGELPGNWGQSRINVADTAAKALHEQGITSAQLDAVQKGDAGAAQKFWETVGQQPGVSKSVASGGRYVPSTATRDMIIDRVKALEKSKTNAPKVVPMDSPSIAKLRAKGLLGDAKTLADLMAGDK